MKEELELIPCNLCGLSRTRFFLESDGFAYRRCTGCGLVYQTPRPVFADLKKRYGAGYFEYESANEDNFFNLMKLGLRDAGFDNFYPGGAGNGNGESRAFLDIGCATGRLLDHVKRKGWRAKGVEICRESAEYARSTYGLDIFIGTLQEADFPDGSFDVVHLSHVIEHVPDPKKLLAEISRIMKPDGHLLLTTPNVSGFQARVSGARWRSAIPDHIYLFSKRTMRNLLTALGFTIQNQVSWGGIPLGKGPGFIKRPADRLAKILNIGDVMLFHCRPVPGHAAALRTRRMPL
jgi:2-polyprenyl-3-methyl-5-hydroxy-6-metoxy-1,4-benzoquinol methylase